MVRIDRKFNEEQLSFETFSLKMHIERDIRKILISGGSNLHKKNAPRGGSNGFNILFTKSFSTIFRLILQIFASF